VEHSLSAYDWNFVQLNPVSGEAETAAGALEYLGEETTVGFRLTNRVGFGRPRLPNKPRAGEVFDRHAD